MARHSWSGEVARYICVAGGTALGYLGLMSLGVLLGLHYFIAILIAQVTTIACAFPIYRSVVFKSSNRVGPDFLRFLTIWSSGAAAGILVTPLLVEVFDWQPIVAQVLAVVGVSVASFLGHRFFSFRPRAEGPLDPEIEAGPNKRN